MLNTKALKMFEGPTQYNQKYIFKNNESALRAKKLN